MTSSPIRYSLRQLRYFVAAADTLSFTAAARQQHVSQPSISTAASELETIFGVQLFLRHHAQGLSLTSAGHVLLRHARQLLRYAEELQLAAEDLGGGYKGTIAFGCLVTLAPMVVPGLTRGLRQAYPGLTLEVQEADQEILFSRLLNGSLESALTYDLQIPPEIEFTPLLDLAPHAVLPPSHPLAEASQIDVADLQAYPYILLDLPLSREYFLSIFKDAGFTPNIAYRSASAEVVRGMVASGVGFTLMNFPRRNTRAVDGHPYVQRRLSGSHRALAFGIMRAKKAKRRHIVELFEQFCTTESVKLASWPDQ